MRKVKRGDQVWERGSKLMLFLHHSRILSIWNFQKLTRLFKERKFREGRMDSSILQISLIFHDILSDVWRYLDILIILTPSSTYWISQEFWKAHWYSAEHFSHFQRKSDLESDHFKVPSGNIEGTGGATFDDYHEAEEAARKSLHSRAGSWAETFFLGYLFYICFGVRVCESLPTHACLHRCVLLKICPVTMDL